MSETAPRENRRKEERVVLLALIFTSDYQNRPVKCFGHGQRVLLSIEPRSIVVICPVPGEVAKYLDSPAMQLGDHRNDDGPASVPPWR